MSGEFENLPKKGADDVSKEVAGDNQAHDPFLEERSLKGPEKVEEKAELKKGDDGQKEAFQEGKESYSDYLARTNTPEQLLAALTKHLENCCEKYKTLQNSPEFQSTRMDIGPVKDGSPADIQAFLSKVKSFGKASDKTD